MCRAPWPRLRIWQICPCASMPTCIPAQAENAAVHFGPELDSTSFHLLEYMGLDRD